MIIDFCGNRLPHEGLENNYCRNPTNHHTAWCFTSKQPMTNEWMSKWNEYTIIHIGSGMEECDVPICEQENEKKDPGMLNSFFRDKVHIFS